MTPSSARLRRAPAALLVALAMIVAGRVDTLSAQQRPVEYLWTADGVRLDWGPDAVWRARARAVAAERARLRAEARFEALNAPLAGGMAVAAPTAVAGALPMPSVLLAFSDTDTSALPRRALYDSLFYTDPPLSGRPYSIRTLYEEMSNGLLTINGSTYGWVVAPQTQSYYLDACGEGTHALDCSTGRARLRELLVAALAELDPSVNFAQYDGDGDGVVDVVQFLQPVVGRECRGPGYGAHKSSISFPTDDDVSVRAYHLTGAVGGAECTRASEIMAIGTAAHELGHGLDLPDLYDTNPNDADDSEGIGEWGLMGSGNYTSLPSPAHFSAWSKERLGWLTVRSVTANETVELGSVVLGDTVLLVRMQGSNPRGEYFLMENKLAAGSDVANMTTGPRPKGGGLLIWHIDSTKIANGWIPLSGINVVNTGTIHGVALEEADGLRELTRGTDRGDAGDPYPGDSARIVFSYMTRPSAATNSDSAFVGFVVDSVEQVVPNGEMRFRVRFGAVTVVRASDPRASITFDGVTYPRFADLLEDGRQYVVGITDPQVTSDGRSRFVFTSWSDGGMREHAITGSTAGDTLTVTVAAEHRLRAVASGTGTIRSEPAVDHDSVFVAADSTITLAATAGSGHVFDGWQGDTTAAGDTLRLAMARPFDVTAYFATPLVVGTASLSAGVMGKVYVDTLEASGGRGAYSWQLASGVLPAGVTLGSNGLLVGRPEQTGTFAFEARVTSGSQQVTQAYALTIAAPALAAADVVAHLVGTASLLTADDQTYLDLLGNRNGRFDLGDFLAWVQETGAVAAPDVQRALGAAMGGGRP